jgi:hypothetical protein
MAWSFRRSLRIGPAKINLSKSGVGYSVGIPGFRAGKDAKGREYTHASIPDTGLYNRRQKNRGYGAILFWLAIGAAILFLLIKVSTAA